MRLPCDSRSERRQPAKRTSVRRVREPAMSDQPNNPLHGLTLQTIVTELVERYGFAQLGELIPINCFRDNPSIRSSLTFLRRTPWARSKVEELYLADLAQRDT
jgi:uncharacterized protein (DUF2132 family)